MFKAQVKMSICDIQNSWKLTIAKNLKDLAKMKFYTNLKILSKI